jgi:hypothetical protein
MKRVPILIVFVAIVRLTGCSSISNPAVAPARPEADVAAHATSWMAQSAAKTPHLLYAANRGNSAVTVYDYKAGNG